jgi:hypothetical protein
VQRKEAPTSGLTLPVLRSRGFGPGLATGSWAKLGLELIEAAAEVGRLLRKLRQRWPRCPYWRPSSDRISGWRYFRRGNLCRQSLVIGISGSNIAGGRFIEVVVALEEDVLHSEDERTDAGHAPVIRPLNHNPVQQRHSICPHSPLHHRGKSFLSDYWHQPVWACAGPRDEPTTDNELVPIGELHYDGGDVAQPNYPFAQLLERKKRCRCRCWLIADAVGECG